MNNIQNTVIALLHLEPYYGHLLLQMNKIFDDSLPCTAGVSITDKVNIHINTKLFDKYSDKEKIGILKHECDHVIFDHANRFKELAKDSNNKMAIWYATDMVVNQFNNYAKSDATVKNVNKQFNLKLENGHLAEYYYAELKKLQNQNKDQAPDHSSWEKSTDNEIIRKCTIIETLEKAAESTKLAKGSMPDNVVKAINDLKSHKINWKTELRRFINVATEVLRDSSRRKINRRFEYANPGTKYDQRLKLVVVSDTSGSTWSYQNDFFKEIEGIYKQGVDITVIECDSEVQNVYPFKPKDTYEVKGAGGTLYNPAFAKAKELKPDAIVFFGDGDCFDEKVIKPKCPVLWVMVNDNKPPVAWGAKVQLVIE